LKFPVSVHEGTGLDTLTAHLHGLQQQRYQQHHELSHVDLVGRASEVVLHAEKIKTAEQLQLQLQWRRRQQRRRQQEQHVGRGSAGGADDAEEKEEEELGLQMSIERSDLQRICWLMSQAALEHPLTGAVMRPRELLPADGNEDSADPAGAAGAVSNERIVLLAWMARQQWQEYFIEFGAE
jgi:hypothetical protein